MAVAISSRVVFLLHIFRTDCRALQLGFGVEEKILKNHKAKAYRPPATPAVDDVFVQLMTLARAGIAHVPCRPRPSWWGGRPAASWISGRR